jgi:hypothetical protein
VGNGRRRRDANATWTACRACSRKGTDVSLSTTLSERQKSRSVRSAPPLPEWHSLSFVLSAHAAFSLSRTSFLSSRYHSARALRKPFVMPPIRNYYSAKENKPGSRLHHVAPTLVAAMPEKQRHPGDALTTRPTMHQGAIPGSQANDPTKKYVARIPTLKARLMCSPGLSPLHPLQATLRTHLYFPGRTQKT